MSLRSIFKPLVKKSQRELWREAMEKRFTKFEALKKAAPVKPQRWVKGQLEYWRRILSEDLDAAPKRFTADVESFRRRLD